MKMISTLILVVSAVLVGQAMAASVPKDVSLIKHSAPKERLDKGRLIEKLSLPDLDKQFKGRVAKYVAKQLYAAKDKATTEVFEDMTVQSLIDLNHMELKSCNAVSMNKRFGKLNEVFQIDREGKAFKLVFGILVFVIQSNFKAFEYCAKYREQVLGQGIASKDELQEWFYHLVGRPKKGAKEAEFGIVSTFTPAMIERFATTHATEVFSPFTGSLIKHPLKSGKLDKGQLIEKLSLAKLHEQHKGKVAEYVAEQLYTAKDKTTTEVLEGVTVQSLIEMNSVGLVSCSKDSMDMMDGKLKKLRQINPEGKKFEHIFGILVFALQAEIMVSEYCLVHREQVVSEKIADEDQMKTFVGRLGGQLAGDDDDESDGDDGDDEVDIDEAQYEEGKLITTTGANIEEGVADLVDRIFHLREPGH